VIELIPTVVEEGGSIIVACHDRDLIGLPGVQRFKLRDGQLEYR
jgi:tungstate transport system ATP-binding protein